MALETRDPHPPAPSPKAGEGGQEHKTNSIGFHALSKYETSRQQLQAQEFKITIQRCRAVAEINPTQFGK